MSKIVLISSGPSIAHYGRMLQNSIPNPENFIIVDLYMEDALEYVRSALPQDTDVIVARGNTAKLLKSSHLSVPIVTIPIRDSELIQSVHTARALYCQEDSAIAYLGMEDIIQSVRGFLELLHCNIRLYPVSSSEDIRKAVKKAAKDQVRVVIGGVYTQAEAAAAGLDCVLLESSLASLKEAYERALEVQKGFLLQRKKFQERAVLLNSITDGILNVSEKGRITLCNPAGERYLSSSFSSLSGKSYTSVFSQTENELIGQALFSGRPMADHSFLLNGQDFLLSIHPILVGSQRKGVILTFHPRGQFFHTCPPSHMSSSLSSQESQKWEKQPAFPSSFFQLCGDHPLFHSAVSLGLSFADCSIPVLLIGEEGTGRETFARCIHGINRPHQLFISREASLLTKEDIMASHQGTLYLRHGERLSLSMQELLTDIIKTGSFALEGGKRQAISIRLMISSHQDLSQALSPGFYYLVNSLILPLPPLHLRSSDIPGLADHLLKRLNEAHKKSCRLSPEFLRELSSLPWPGNLKQLESYLRRLVAQSPKEHVFSSLKEAGPPDDSQIYSFLEKGFSPQPDPLSFSLSEANEPGFIIKGRKISQRELLELDRFFQGKKGLIAQKLGISRSTLWRCYKEMEGKAN